jgi:hypothetical protein
MAARGRSCGWYVYYKQTAQGCQEVFRSKAEKGHLLSYLKWLVMLLQRIQCLLDRIEAGFEAT